MKPKSIVVKNRFSALDQMDEESNIVGDREDGSNDIVLEDSQVKDLRIDLPNIGKVRTRKILVMCYAGVSGEKERQESAE